VIENITVEVLSRQPPLDHTSAFSPSTGALGSLELSIDLDQAHPTLTEKTDAERRPFFERGSISLSELEPYDLRVQAEAHQSYAEWVLVVHYTVGERSKTRTQRVPNRGGRFRTTSEAERYRRDYEWTWAADWPSFQRPTEPAPIVE
jgi:hypothetical protein